MYNLDYKFVKRKGDGSNNRLESNLDEQSLDVSTSARQPMPGRGAEQSTREVRQVEMISDSTNVTMAEAELCVHPEYLVFTWVMCLVALATTLKLYFIIKTLLALFMVTFYALLVIVGYPRIFLEYPETK